MNKKHKNVVVFSGANAHDDYNNLAYSVGKLLAQNSFVTITGGGSGLMTQVNKGALEHGGESIGICVNYPGKECNRYVTSSKSYDTFSKRHDALIRMGDAYVVLPGGLGTLLEIVEITQLKKFGEVAMEAPLLLVSPYYKNLTQQISWMKETGFINEDLHDLYTYVETPDDMIALLTT